jgi:hypothetical protein
MSIPPQLGGKLQEVLGREAAELFVSMLEGIRADLAELKHELLRVELRLNDRLDSKIGTLGKDMSGALGSMEKSVADLRVQMERQHASLLKWSFAFWVGAVASIAALAGVLR